MDMRERFRDLWKRVKAKGDPDKVFDQLVDFYTQPHRHYHTFNHIRFCLELLDEFNDIVDDFYALEWAIWFHDVIYEIPGPDNEAESAELAMETARDAGLNAAFIKRAGRYVLVTKSHTASGKAGEYDERVMCDIDLAILGQPPEVYDQYEENICREYTTRYTIEEFRPGRRAFLIRFSQSSPIFQTARFKARFEDQAKANLIRTAEKLKV